MARYIDADDFMMVLKLFEPDKKVKIGTVSAALDTIPTADVVERKDLISFLRMIVSDLNKEMDECLERKEFTSRFYLKAKRTMVEHLISIFEEANDGEIH